METKNIERDAKIEALYNEGLTYNEIASRLKGVTRNQVSGAVWRMRLVGKCPARERPTEKPREYKAQKYNGGFPVLPKMGKIKNVDWPYTVLGKGKTIMELKNDDCRFPCQDGIYCSAPVERGAYCKVHGIVAYQGKGARL